MNVLIADDDGLVAHQTGRVIQRLGHTIVGTASTGRAAIEMARSLRPDLALLDIVMPGGHERLFALGPRPFLRHYTRQPALIPA